MVELKLALAVTKYIDLKRQTGYAFANGRKSLNGFSRRFGDTDLCNITTDLVSSFLNETNCGCLHWHAKYGILSNFFSYWADRHEMPELEMPTRRPKPRSTFVPYIFSRNQLRDLLKATTYCQNSRDHIDAPVMRTLVLLLYATGARTEEILRLHLNDVRFTERLINIEGRGPRDRQIPIGEGLAEILRKYVKWRTKRSHLGQTFLITKNDAPISAANAARYFEKIRKKAGVSRFDGASYQPRLCDLKCTFAVHRITSWIRNGADLNRMLPALAAYMGQSGLGSAERYLSLTPARFQKQLNKLSPERRKFHWRNDRGLMIYLSSL